MTNEQVDKLEAVFREAQNKIEEAGRLLCSERGDVAPWMWGGLQPSFRRHCGSDTSLLETSAG